MLCYANGSLVHLVYHVSDCIIFFCAWCNLVFFPFTVATKHTKSTVKVVSKRSCWMTDLETNKSDHGPRSWEIGDGDCLEVRRSPFHHGCDSEKRMRWWKLFKDPLPWRQHDWQKLEQGSVRHGETPNDPDWRPDTEVYPSRNCDSHSHSKSFVCDLERKGWTQQQCCIYC